MEKMSFRLNLTMCSWRKTMIIRSSSVTVSLVSMTISLSGFCMIMKPFSDFTI